MQLYNNLNKVKGCCDPLSLGCTVLIYVLHYLIFICRLARKH